MVKEKINHENKLIIEIIMIWHYARRWLKEYEKKYFRGFWNFFFLFFSLQIFKM